MILGPVGERLPRTLDKRQPLGGVGRVPDGVQRQRHIVRQRRVIVLGLRLDVMGGAGGRGVAVRPVPVNARGRQIHQLQRRIRYGRGRHREDDAIADTRGLAIAYKRRAVRQKDAQQRRVVVGGGCRGADRNDKSRRKDCGRHRAAVHEVSSVVCTSNQVKLWKTC